LKEKKLENYLGVIARCTPGFCQNGGICEERASGATIYAYCRCPTGFSGQCCQTRMFSNIDKVQLILLFCIFSLFFMSWFRCLRRSS